MVGVVLAVMAAYGVHLAYSAAAFQWTGVRPGPRPVRRRPRRSAQAWLVQAGLEEVTPRTFVGVVGVMATLGAAVGYVLFGTPLPTLVAAALVGTTPITAYRRRREVRRSASQDAWPRLIEEVRVLASSAGRSIPHALFEAGRHTPPALRSAFEAAEREWGLSTDFARTLDLLKQRLSDPTAGPLSRVPGVAAACGG